MMEYSLERSALTPSSVVRTSSPDTDVGGSTSSNISLHPAQMISRSITAVNLFIIDNFLFSITCFNYNYLKPNFYSGIDLSLRRIGRSCDVCVDIPGIKCYFRIIPRPCSPGQQVDCRCK